MKKSIILLVLIITNSLFGYGSYEAIDKAVTGDSKIHGSAWSKDYGYNQPYSQNLLREYPSLPNYHTGMDISLTNGTKVYSLADGVVSRIKKSIGAVFVKLKEQKGTIVYMHLSEINVKKDDPISINTLIGKSGDKGVSGVYHLHLAWLKEDFYDKKNSNPDRPKEISKFNQGLTTTATDKTYDLKNLKKSTHSDFESYFDGAGSIVRPNIKNKKSCQWGCYRDEADMQVHAIPSTISFQWKKTASCSKLKIGVLAGEKYRNKYNTWIHPYKALKVKIYRKEWDSNTVYESFETTLPKTVEFVSNWNNIIVSSKNPLLEKVKIIAECTDSDDGKDVTMLNETAINLPLNYKFAGQSSVIRGSNSSYNGQKDGIYQDVAIGLSDNKSMTLFQWQTSKNCSSLILKMGHYPNENGLKSSINGVDIKSWSVKDWNKTTCKNTLPCTITAPDGGNKNYYIIKVKSNANTFNRISAVCKN